MSLRDRVRRYKSKMYKYWRSHGLCGRCGLPVEIYRITGKSYSECFKHRLQSANRQRTYQRIKRKLLKFS
jgi:hypothetical protein